MGGPSNTHVRTEEQPELPDSRAALTREGVHQEGMDKVVGEELRKKNYKPKQKQETLELNTMAPRLPVTT